MSGRNQHHFWQLLQRGFSVERKPNYNTVYAYSKNKDPFLVGTRNYGAERDFFDFEPGEGADVIVSKTENELQGLVRHLQNDGLVSSEQTEEVAILIEHLETRTKFFRQHLAETVVDMTAELGKWFSDPNIFRKLLAKFASENVEKITSSFEGQVENPNTRTAIAEFVVDNLENIDLEIFKSASDDTMNSLRYFAGMISELSKKAHIESVLRKSSDSARVRRYKGLKYRVATGFDGRLICPDTMVSFLTDRKPKPFLDKPDHLEAVWLPLTSDLMLIGETGARVDRDIQTVQHILASTSFSGFIAKYDTKELRSLSPRIGRNAQIISAEELKSIQREILAQLLGD